MPVFDPGVPWLRGSATLTNGSTTVTTDGVITLNEILEGDRLYVMDGGERIGPLEIVGGEGDEIELREPFEGATGSYAIAIDRNPITRTGAKTLRDVSRILATIEDADVEVIGEIRDETVAAKEAAEALYGDLGAVEQAREDAQAASGSAAASAGNASQSAVAAQQAELAATTASSQSEAARDAAAISANAAALTEQDIADLTGDFTGSYDTYVFTAAGSETSLSGQDDTGKTLSYSPGTASVYRNGVKLIAGSDYSATDGTSITDLDPLDPGDKVEVQAFNLFSVIDSARRSQNLADLGDWPEAVRNLGEFDDGEALLDDTSMAYGVGPRRVSPGDLIRVRAEGQAFEVADSEASGGQHFTTAGGVVLRPPPRDPNAVPNIEALALMRGVFHDQIARVVHNRHFGYFKWRSGDVSTMVAEDPYRGLWVPPAHDPTGASGAWERVVEKGVYDAEWWLPETMPTNAQVQLNAAINSLPDTAGRFVLPRREVLVTDYLRFTKGITYEGFSHKGRINGQGGKFYGVLIQASNALVKRVKSGNVYGQVGMGEPGGFHINDGATSNNQYQTGTAIYNVGLEDCEAYDAEQGVRFGFSTWGRDMQPEVPEPTYWVTHDCWATNFRASGIERMGIELMRAHDIEISNPMIEMAPQTPNSHHERGVRAVGAKRCVILGGNFQAGWNTGWDSSTTGLSFEQARNCTVEGTRLVNFSSYLRTADAWNLKISGVTALGANDEHSRFLEMTSQTTPSYNITVSDCTAINVSTFVTLYSGVMGLKVTDNYHIDNDPEPESGSRYFFLLGPGSSVKSGVEISRNRYYSGKDQPHNAIRLNGVPSGSDFTIDDNIMTGGLSIADPFDGDVYTRGLNSNRIVSNALWSEMRGRFEQEVPLTGDHHEED